MSLVMTKYTEFSEDVARLPVFKERLKVYNDRLTAFSKHSENKLNSFQRKLIREYWENYNPVTSIGSILDFNREYASCLTEWSLERAGEHINVESYIKNLESEGWAFIYVETKCACSKDDDSKYQCSSKYEWVILSPI